VFGLKKLFSRGDGVSKVLAKSRLHFVLVQDRAGLTNEELAQFKREMIAVIERYFLIDESGFDMTYQRDKDTTTLLINSPIILRRDSDASREKTEVKAESESLEPVPEPVSEADTPPPSDEDKESAAG
jgi:cell division topological specificity factor